MKRFFLLIFFSCSCIVIRAQYNPDVFPDEVFSKNIKSCRIYKDGWDMSYPVLLPNDENGLILSFDELSDNARYFSYTVIHCDADWRQSRLTTDDYMTGFPVNRITQYEYSFNTLIPYVHYRLPLPDNDVRLKVSGNYAVVVFEEGNESQPVLCRRFCIAEGVAVASARATQARQTARQKEWQQIDLTVRTVNYPIENPHNDVKLVILQNGQWNTAKTDVKPLFVRQNELDYRYTDETLLFPAGNEYRPLDIKSRQFSSTRMQAVEFERPTYHFYPFPDQSREGTRYFYYEDLNGKYAVQADKTQKPEWEADYVYVHFTFEAPQPSLESKIYVVGEFCNNKCSDENLMTYNFSKKQYEAKIMLKQGYYNYRYVEQAIRGKNDDINRLEGNFADTENDYLIFIYHRGRSSRYDRLIGFSSVNTLRN